MKRKALSKSGTRTARSRRESGVPGGGKGRQDEVRGSGVYPLSGPWPSGSAPIRTEMEWGQGERGAAGYEESGGSELSGLPGTGQFAPKGRKGRRQRRHTRSRGQAGLEIPRSQWVTFLDNFNKAHDGWPTSVEVMGGGKRVRIEARRLPLVGITVDLKPRAKETTSIIMDMQPNVHLTHMMPRTKRLNFREDQQELEIVSASGDRAIVRFQRPSKKQ